MHALAQILRAIAAALRDARVRSLLAFTGAMIFWASAFYRFVEGWGWVDAIYFSVVTISTVGFGDFSPESVAGKLFTVAYIILGLGVFVATASTIADAMLSHYRTEREEKPEGKSR